MSAVSIVRSLLLAYQPLRELVPADDIVAGTVPDGILPAIGIKEVGGGELETVGRAEGATLCRIRVQVTVYAKTYPEQKALLHAAGLGRGVHSGTVDGFVVRSVLPAGIGPDLSDDDAGVYSQSRDFKVAYIQPH
ncbi:hypothetical protein GTP38_23320 [Duganella sp. FT94W]|uniref:DUF3168 domain-containing protein n=1 Tax=Duganella lactea TaxID=2692173 RepID=A0ABW9VE20_9BURK|nr:hypothetical protein [Duganella lactea]MYM37261.1 hypothetical protein [Duganella lactea]